MSQLNSDDLDDEWDDFTPSLQDILFENLENAENNARMRHNDDDYQTNSEIDSDILTSFSSSKAAFDVFLDELFEIPFKVKTEKSKNAALNEISTNEHHEKISLLDNANSENRTVEEKGYFHDSQDDNMWSDFDINLFSSIEKEATNNNSLDSSIQQEQDDNKSNNMPMFKTASNKAIKPPSETAKQKAIEILMDNHSEDIMTNDAPSFSGFSTASGKPLKPISEEAKLRALAILQDTDEAANKTQSKEASPPLIGFTTASGKAIKPISEKSKQKAIALFKEIEEETKGSTKSDNKLEEPLTTFSERGIQLATELFKETDVNDSVIKNTQMSHKKRPLDEPLDRHSKYENILNQYGGFQMGNNRKGVEVSNMAKRQAIAIFEKDSATSSPTTDQLSQNDIKSNPISSTSNSPIIPDNRPLKKGNNDTLMKLSDKTNIPSVSKYNKRVSTMMKQNKPFKSPIIHSNIELTKAAIKNKSTSKTKSLPVFDLNIPNNRSLLSSLGKPLQYSKEELLAKNIPISVIYMSASNAKKYMFEGNWGWKEAEKSMINAGALSNRISSAWVENHYGLIVWKIACLIRSYPDIFKNDWNSQKVLDQLLYRYEREINLGHRPVLKKILEQDDISVKHMVLFISDIIEIKSSSYYNTSNKFQLILSDGWYQVPACIDKRMEQAIEKKRLKIGYKLSICGAQIIGDRVAQSPLSIKDNSTMLSITTNGCLPARWDTKLGYQKKKLIIRTLPTIFDDGGLVPALDIVVCRKMPILYSESLPNGTIVTRTAKEEEEVRRMAHGYGHYGGLHRQSSCISIPNFRTEQRTSNTPHLDRTLSEPRSFEDRRVSGYFKIRICDSNSLSNRHWATLLLSNANELNHLDIVEGNRYKIFFVMPYQPKNKKYLGLDLKTTRMTRWEPVPNINITNTYIPRFLTECKDIRHQDTTSDFDLVILILQIGTATLEHLNGRKLWHQTLLVTDESEGICQINLKLPFNPIPDIKGQVIGLVNVRYETYDSKFDITCLKATDETEVLSKASSAAEYMQKGLSKLRNWVQSNPDRIHTITERIQNLIQ